jgi:predicted transcriptional regulator
MARQRLNLPTDGELEILGVLWTRGPSTVREVFRTLAEARKIGYTTVLKLMQIMTEKGFISPDRSVRPQVYAPVQTQKQTQSRLVRRLLEQAFSGSAGNLVLQVLSARKASPEELRDIRKLLNRLERESK